MDIKFLVLGFSVFSGIASPAFADSVWDKMAEKAKNSVVLDKPQYLVVVDRNPLSQLIGVLETKEDGTHTWVMQEKTSTGNEARRGYFVTPTGVFRPLAGGSYRAEGTRNSKGVRGLGSKGMRVWDFGWQQTIKDGATREIRLQMHATDPDLLEQKLGSVASKGCVRVSSTMNKFIDEQGVLDAPWKDYQDKYGYQLSPVQRASPSPLAGSYMVVVDSSEFSDG